MRIRRIWVNGSQIDDPLGATLLRDGPARWRASVPLGDYLPMGEPVVVTVALVDGQVLRGRAHLAQARGHLVFEGDGSLTPTVLPAELLPHDDPG